MEIICQFVGEVTYDITAHIKYRQHSNNVIGVPTSKKQQVIGKLRRIVDPDKQPRYIFAKIIYENLASNLTRMI